jgi:ATP-dependent DNA helicase RecG
VEVISPESLPNHLTVKNIKAGNSVMRNPLLTSYGAKMMPYSGIGSGVPRVLKNEPSTIFLNEIEGEQFKVTFRCKNLR